LEFVPVSAKVRLKHLSKADYDKFEGHPVGMKALAHEQSIVFFKKNNV